MRISDWSSDVCSSDLTWIIAGGVFLWSLMTLACGFANSFLTLFVARIGLGIGEAALAPAGFSLLADSFRPRRLVRATSIFSLGSQIGRASCRERVCPYV